MFNDPAFMLYAMECEGELNTRQSKINRVIKTLINHPNKRNPFIIEDILVQCGLTHITDAELEYIRREAGINGY